MYYVTNKETLNLEGLYDSHSEPSSIREEEEAVRIWNTPLLVASTALGLSRESPEITFCSDRRVIDWAHTTTVRPPTKPNRPAPSPHRWPDLDSFKTASSTHFQLFTHMPFDFCTTVRVCFNSSTLMPVLKQAQNLPFVPIENKNHNWDLL